MANDELLVDVYSEGATEKNVVAKLRGRRFVTPILEERGGDGEKTMMRKLRLAVRAWYESSNDPRGTLRILVLRDWDKHEGKTIEDICKSTVDVVRPFDPTVELLTNPAHENVFELQTALTGLQLVLHIVDQSFLPTFVKATIDDYVLKLALMDATATALLQNRKEAAARQNPPRDWLIETPALQNKILEEIPRLLSQNKIPPMLEAKEYVRFYSTLLQLHSSPATFAEKVLANADENDIREVFAPLLAAIDLFSA